jgi:hypothetical protein
MKSQSSMIAAGLLLAVSSAVAQVNPDRPQNPQRRAARGAQQPDSMARNRAMLEDRVRQRLGQMAKNQMGLNDSQVQKLQQTNAKFQDRRRMLNEQERDIRMSLREEMITGDSSRQKQVGELLDRMVKTQHLRIDLLEAEQKELGSFLTPMQRARYFGMEEQLRQRVQQMREQGGEPGMGPDGPGGPGRMGGRGRIRPNGPPPDEMPLGGPPPGANPRRRPACTPPNCPAPPVS